MKALFLFAFAVSFTFSLHAQPHYEKVDSVARSFTGRQTNAAQLAMALTAPFQTEHEKARVIFTWIAYNIRYDCKKFHEGSASRRMRFSGASAGEIEQQMAEYQEDQIEETLKTKKGVCADYSRLFQVMCKAAGLESAVVSGTARNFRVPFRKLPNRPNHDWNAIQLDGRWHLLDVTWAAGYTDDEVKKFTACFFPGYFLTPPERFVQNHFPEDEKWQLLDRPVSRKEFPEQPLINFGQSDYLIEDFSLKPAEQNGQLEIRLKFRNEPPALIVTANSTRMLETTRIAEDGCVVLRFHGPGSREIAVFGGRTGREMEWMARYAMN